jgi:F-type H+-transporting ATPase subunit delta
MTTVVTITSAVPLSESQKKALTDGLKKKYSAVSIEEQIDENIIGGVKVTVGDKQFDATLRGRLSKLKETIT